MAEDCFHNELCRVWLRHHQGLFRFHASITLTQFIGTLKTRANMLAKYIRKANEQQVRQQVPRRAGNSLMRMSSMSLPSVSSG